MLKHVFFCFTVAVGRKHLHSRVSKTEILFTRCNFQIGVRNATCVSPDLHHLTSLLQGKNFSGAVKCQSTCPVLIAYRESNLQIWWYIVRVNYYHYFLFIACRINLAKNDMLGQIEANYRLFAKFSAWSVKYHKND